MKPICLILYFFLSPFLIFAQIDTSLSPVRTLEYFLQQASQNSPLLRGLQNQLLQNSLDSLLLRDSLRTRVDFVSNNNYAPIINGYGYDEAISNGATVSGLFQAQKYFISPGYLSALHNSIGLQRSALNDTIQLSRKELARTIGEQYIAAYGNMLTMNYSADVYQLLKKEETALKKLTEQSVYNQTDYLAFYVTMQQQELTYLQAKIQYEADYLVLNYLAGIVDTTIGRLQEPALMHSLSNGFEQSVFYRRYVTDSLRIANERLLIGYSYKPHVGIFTDAGYNSSMMYTPYKNFGFSVGVNLTIPIYDGGQKAVRYQRLQIEERTRQVNKTFFVNQYHQQMALLYRQLRATDDLVSKIKQQITFTNTLIKADIRLLETGDIRLLDLITAINNYFNAQNLFRQNNISRLRIINQINYWNR